ncbi:polysaccharide deacetylase family protein [Sporomusa sphaeroides]|uniref:Peptidoglycan-N-acetylglucosamine deacetylase n=2 Tax=Sporomusa TaxID=2375 RepID=A0ABM9WAB4_9FIRM|nr:polysaccharide deacetylase family protein [Sporomusa sphaeroides]OLS54967.1 peptidoglycan-N-acetylglucosamine deacetylase [Sporomusa sphaeroides DSM 2875]CVK21913.1 Peptidoglycan-N-acetylglucosamine deacetylase [Sporomusa sphaeroides DSM 2875]SCM83809.1 Polysaccharide deacetylase [uncultured Sporomusa sp.]
MRRFHLMLCAAVIMAAMFVLIDRESSNDTKIISKVPTTQKVVALTIDDGPHNKVTPEILAILKDKNVKATFFVLGKNVEDNPRIFAQEIADGHEVGVHTYSHSSLPKLSDKKIEEEFEKAEKVILPITAMPTLFRPPGGAFNERVIRIAKQRGYQVVLWSIDTRDWECPPEKRIIDEVYKAVKPGSIILMHDGQYPIPTPRVLGTIIDGLRERGYIFVTVSELLQYNEVGHTFRPFGSPF